MVPITALSCRYMVLYWPCITVYYAPRLHFYCCWKYTESSIFWEKLIGKWILDRDGMGIARDILKKYLDFQNATKNCNIQSRSGIHWLINFSKEKWQFCIFSKTKKMQNWREEKGHFSFKNCPNFVTIFCQVLKIKIIFFWISLAIPRPLQSGIHWPNNFSKKIDVSVY